MEMLPVQYSSALGPQGADNVCLWVTLGTLAHGDHGRSLTDETAYWRYTAQYNNVQCSRDKTIPLHAIRSSPQPRDFQKHASMVDLAAGRPSQFSSGVPPSTRDGGRTPRRTRQPEAQR